ncbi:MAG TPA: polyprenyl diphosphate synthase [Candidatus Saccharimonadales bacterium]|nr:polyprenyl diphosphate synthase [Candidatus Saccharimonadales bacterium]
MQQKSSAPMPTHLGFIIDGNRRWAKEHGLPSYEGHLAGYNALKDVLYESFDQGIKFASVYAFSTENWKRAEEEVGYLMKLTLRMVKSDLHEFIERGIRFRHLGSKEGLPDKVVKAFEEAEEKTKDLKKGTVCACFNYGGQREIVDAARKCLEDGLSAEQITEEAIAARLYAPEVPPIDMMIRTSGERRISNFMLWRIAYSELMFIDKFWPAMTKEDVTSIIEEYGRRNRRFGGN